MMWYAIDLTTTQEAREAAEYALMEAGAAGTEAVAEADGQGPAAADSLVRVSGYFEAEPRIESVRATLREALRIYGHASSAVGRLRLREVAERDWLAEWKKSWRPLEVGRRFVIAPPWSEVSEREGGRLRISIEPGMAFGTGTHETTRLCLAAIEEHFDGGRFLDVGTGTGILAIAAALLRPEACVEACDTDPAAITIAHENAIRNGVAERINFRVGSLEADARARADFVCANLTADAILALLPALLSATRRRLVLSGLLVSQTDTILARLKELDAGAHEVKTEGEWAAIIV
jgi:ribosomal protein L11 methyltransferase